ncbi:5863_t:CDS:2, partial [Acaulospora colombiana]
MCKVGLPLVPHREPPGQPLSFSFGTIISQNLRLVTTIQELALFQPQSALTLAQISPAISSCNRIDKSKVSSCQESNHCGGTWLKASKDPRLVA